MAVRIIIWSLNNRWLVIGAGRAGCGRRRVLAVESMNFDAFPDTTPVQVQINTPAPALVPEEIERLITFPVELADQRHAPGCEQVRSRLAVRRVGRDRHVSATAPTSIWPGSRSMSG